MIPIVLASASPRRRALLEALGIDLSVQVSDVSESLDGIPHEVVRQNAAAKRDDVSCGLSHPAMVIAADTIVVLHKGRIKETGTHDELLAAKGLYWKLYRLQSEEAA